MDRRSNDVESVSDREIMMTRVIDAPREVVWKAWTDPARILKWWGPTGFTTTTRRMDVRAGGEWRFVMHGPDGRDYVNRITYLEVVKPERLVYKHGGDVDCEPVNFQVTVEFEEAGASGEQTLLSMRMVFPSSSAREFVMREYNALEGAKQTMLRLRAFVEESGAQGASPPFVITRAYEVDRGTMFKLWTEERHLRRWFGPKGVKLESLGLDLRPGGVFHYRMDFAGGEHWGKWTFREITPPERLVFVVSFADAQGRAARNPWEPGWPLEWLSVVTFSEHAGKSRGTVVTVTWTALSTIAAEQKTFDDGHSSMQQGWGGTMDQLGEYLRGEGARG